MSDPLKYYDNNLCGTTCLPQSMVARAVTGHPIPANEAPRRVGDPAILVASSEKARRVLGWQPKLDSLEDIIATAWAWHKNHPNGFVSSQMDRRRKSKTCFCYRKRVGSEAARTE